MHLENLILTVWNFRKITYFMVYRPLFNDAIEFGGDVMKALVFLANGFEEMEMTYPVSILRAAGFDVVTISIMDTIQVVGSHGINIIADSLFENIDLTDADIIILPGGQPGTEKLDSFAPLKSIIMYYAENKAVAAICAAPSILGKMGILNGKKAICYPGYEKELKDAVISNSKVVTDGNLITAAGPGVAKEFAFEIVRYIGTVKEYEKICQMYK